MTEMPRAPRSRVRLISSIGRLNGMIPAVTPKMPNTLNVLEPRTLPSATSGFFFRAAIVHVTSSGRLVPIATTVIPITVCESAMLSASSIQPSMRNRAPKMMPDGAHLN